MRKLFLKPLRFAVLGAALSAGATIAHGQSFSMQIVADNDFAVFAGTASGVTELLYQNDYSWPDQIDNLSTLSFDLQNGETTFYVLGMGGGGQENISGTVNDVDITTIGDISMSSDLGPYLTDFETQSDGGTVADGTFDAKPSQRRPVHDLSELATAIYQANVSLSAFVWPVYGRTQK